MGYVIPVPVIRHFLDDLEDGEYDGFPWAGFSCQPIANPAITERYGLEEEQRGILVTGLAGESPASGVLRVGDVVLEMDGFEITGDGTIELRPGIRTSLDYLITRRQLGERIPLRLVRSGSEMSVEMTLDMTFSELCLIPNSIYDRPLEYFVFGGLVFMPLTLNYLETWGPEWYLEAPGYLTTPYFYRNWRTEDRSGIVILAYTLPADVNTGYQDQYNVILEEINGERVRDFADLVRLIESAHGDYVEVLTNTGDMLAMDREEAIERGEEIMLRYGIPEDGYLEE